MSNLKSSCVLFCLFLPLPCLAQKVDTGVPPDSAIDRIMQAHYAAGDFSGTVLVARRGVGQVL